MKSSLPALFFMFFFASCVMSPVPNEDAQILKNLSLEYCALADGFMEQKNYAKAIEFYTKAARNKDIKKQTDYKLARAYALHKDWNKSLALYDSLLKLDPQNKNFLESKAWVLASSGQLEPALQLYKELIFVYKEDSGLQKNYINILISLKQLDDARNQVAEFKKNFPEDKSLDTIEKSINDLQAKPESADATKDVTKP